MWPLITSIGIAVGLGLRPVPMLITAWRAKREDLPKIAKAIARFDDDDSDDPPRQNDDEKPTDD